MERTEATTGLTRYTYSSIPIFFYNNNNCWKTTKYTYKKHSDYQQKQGKYFSKK